MAIAMSKVVTCIINSFVLSCSFLLRISLKKQIYAFSIPDLKYLSNKGPKPHHNFTKVPFVVSNQKGKLLYENYDAGAEYPFFKLFSYVL